MDVARIREGIRKMRFSAIWDCWGSGEIGQDAAAELLGMSVRSFQRWKDRYEAEGEAGLVDRRGGPSPKRTPAEEVERMLGLYRDKYADFTVKHFHEQLQKRHNYTLGYTVTKLHLHRAGLVRPAPKRSAHRKKRPRRPMRGMMLHQDGSRHVWIEGQPPMDLIVTMDDATSEIYSMILVAEERTASTFEALRGVIGEHGLFCALYTDRGSHYFHTPEAGGKVSSTVETQAGRALAHLGIEHIAAYSPQARGRSERLFATLQDRLPKELRLAGIGTVEAANAWLKSRYIAEHNARFAVDPEQEGSAFVPDEKEMWREILCVIEERTVSNDNTVAWNGKRLQLPESRLRPHFVRSAGPGARLSGRRLGRLPRSPPARRLRSPGSPPRPECAEVWRRARGRQGRALSGALARVLDRPCARRQFAPAGRDEETAVQPNKETARSQRGNRGCMTTSNRAVRRLPTPFRTSTRSRHFTRYKNTTG
jgi:transposase